MLQLPSLILLLLLAPSSAFRGAPDEIPFNNSPHSFVELADDFYRPPLDLRPLSLSGNYGEFRTNHFHSGLDFRIGGVEGEKLYAVAQGYVSRIGVSSGGYGNALYITHPNGTVSVYGHMQKFEPRISAFVEESQYKTQSFVQDIYLGPEDFPVQKGQYIGNAGNSGASGGPHLHFEIRDSLETPLNLLYHNVFALRDSLSPVLRRIHFYAFGRRLFIPYSKMFHSADLSRDSVRVAVTDTFYVAISATDRMQGTYARLGIARYEVFIDDSLCWAYDAGDIPFSRSRYINSLVEYSEKASHGRMMIKTFIEPGNALKSCITCGSDGLISLRDENTHVLSVRVRDYDGNSDVHNFRIYKGRRNPINFPNDTLDGTSYRQFMYWNMPNRFSANGLRVSIPRGALYDNLMLRIKQKAPARWDISGPEAPLQKAATIEMFCPGLDSLQKTKACLARIIGQGKLAFVGGYWRGDTICAATTSFGNFVLSADTTAPTIKGNIRKGADLRGRKQLSFSIADDFSGIASYRASLDGKWMLAKFDAKYARLHCVLSAKRHKRGQKHQFCLVVTDNCGNENKYQTEILW